MIPPWVVFLDLNDQRATLTHHAAFDLVVAIATAEVDVEEIAERLQINPRG